MPFHLKHSATGHLMYGPNGHLSSGCPGSGGGGGGGGGGCACLDTVSPCSLCAGDTPSQFHVSIVGVTICADCVACGTSGPWARAGAGASVNGSYVLTKNGACGWTAGIPAMTANLYATSGCGGSPTPLDFAVDLVRIAGNIFRLQITDAGGNVLIFTGDVTIAACCTAFTISSTGGCGCLGSPAVFFIGSGGTATVTPC